MIAHHLDIIRIFSELKTSVNGLSAAEASRRLVDYGFNLLEARDRRAPLSIFFRQFLNPLIYVLVAAASIKALASRASAST